ncbi:MAG: late competence development ComFB family protein [Oscillospiraceae bacterium]|jgi:competence protein ComFB|nr:late competence development ComFB family protein [Oscillospiraceae bacterium]
MIINVTEKVVTAELSRYLESATVCKCAQCIEDITCIALNKLPPKYVSTSKGELFSRVDSQMMQQTALDFDVAILGAIEFVKLHPRHTDV